MMVFVMLMFKIMMFMMMMFMMMIRGQEGKLAEAEMRSNVWMAAAAVAADDNDDDGVSDVDEYHNDDEYDDWYEYKIDIWDINEVKCLPLE